MSAAVASFPRVNVRLLGRECSLFQVFGCAGLLFAAAGGLFLVQRLGLSSLAQGILMAAAVATFLGLAMLTKVLTGEEKLIYYHHETAVLLISAAVLRVLGQPVLPYLDITILGIGAFLVFGRLGCLMVGCCHGAPAPWGVTYRPEHADAGFPDYLVGVRLFPAQAAEALAVLTIVSAGISMVLRGEPSGSALAFYVVSYGAVRFALEFARGDAARRYFVGSSEAQWFSFGLTLAILAAELRGRLAFHWWHAGVAAAMAVAMIAAGMAPRSLLSPQHVKEVAEAVQRLRLESGQGIAVVRTSLEVRISGGLIPAIPAAHYTFSRGDGTLLRSDAARLARLIVRLSGLSGREELLGGNRGVFHLVIHLTPEGLGQ
jgi:hypothetical protein